MYCEILNKNDYNSIFVVEAVLDNLCAAAKNEMLELLGENYGFVILSEIEDTEIFIIRLKANSEPVGIFGVKERADGGGEIYFLSGENIKNGNVISLIRGAKKQINIWLEKYNALYDWCSKKNFVIKKWLKLLGFEPIEDLQDENFQMYKLQHRGIN